MLTPGRHYVNTKVRVAVNFQDEDRVDTDPDTVVFKVRSPTGITTSYTYNTDAALLKSSVGDYYIDVTPDQSGRWYYRWESTGTDKAIAIEGSFVVQASPFFDDLELDAYRT